MEEAFQRGWSITASNAAETELDEDTLLVLSLSSKKSVPPPRDGLGGFLMGSHTPLHLPCIVIIFFFFFKRPSAPLHAEFLEGRDGVFLINDMELNAMHLVVLILVHTYSHPDPNIPALSEALNVIPKS